MLSASADRLALVCLIAFAPFPALWANPDQVHQGGGRLGEMVVQPGIVEEIAPPWENRWSLFDGSHRPFPISAAASVNAIWNDNVLLFRQPVTADFLWDATVAAWYESSPLEDERRHYLRIGYDPQFLRYHRLNYLDGVNQRWDGRYLFRGSRFSAGASHRFAEFSGESRAVETGINAAELPGEDPSTGESNLEEQDLTEAERDLGRRLQGHRERTSAFAMIELSDKTSLRPAVMRHYQTVDGVTATGYEEWWGEATGYYRIDDKLRLGLRTRGGRVEFDAGSEQTYLRIESLARWLPSSKFKIETSAGADVRDISVTGSTETTPLFLARFVWLPSRRTTIYIEGSQNARASILENATTYTGVKAGLRQQFLRNFEYSLRGGYVRTEFSNSAESATEQQRQDDYLFLRNSLGYQCERWGEIALFHEFRENNSNRSQNYERNLTGISLGFEF